MADNPNPQKTAFADSPGEYKLVCRTPKPEVNPGEDIIIEVFITGYGRIRGPKVVFYPPKDLVAFTSQGGWVVGRPGLGGVMMTTRGWKHDLLVITLGVDEERRWLDHDAFVDETPTNSDVSSIAAEHVRGTAPITATFGTKARSRYAPTKSGFLGKLQVLGWAVSGKWRAFWRRLWGRQGLHERPLSTGSHNFQVFFTYFNGNVWKTDASIVSVTVRNLFQRHPYVTWGIGTFGAVIALGSFIRLNLDILSKILGALWYWLTQVL